MQWWQIVLTLLITSVLGVIVGIILSYVILRFVKHERVTLGDFIQRLGKKSAVRPAMGGLLDIVTTNLFLEITNNSRIAAKAKTTKLSPFETRVWNKYRYNFGGLPPDLLEELNKVYYAIGIANSIASASEEVRKRTPNSEEGYRKLCTNIAERLDRIKLQIEHLYFLKSLTETQPMIRGIRVHRQFIPSITWQNRMIEPLIYLLAISAAQTVTALYIPLWGIIVHIVIVVFIILRSALTRDSVLHHLLLALALVPLLRISTLILPLGDIPPMLSYFIGYALIFLAAIFIVYIAGYKPEQIGVNLKRPWIQLAVAVAGIAFGLIGYLVQAPQSFITELTWKEVWLPTLVLLMCAGLMPEFVFRGLLQYTATRAFGWSGIVYVSLLSAITHIGLLPAIGLAFTFMVALFFGWVVKKTGSIIGVALSYGIYNIFLYLIFPFVF